MTECLAIWKMAADKYGPKQYKEIVTELKPKVRENHVGKSKGKEMSSDMLKFMAELDRSMSHEKVSVLSSLLGLSTRGHI